MRLVCNMVHITSTLHWTVEKSLQIDGYVHTTTLFAFLLTILWPVYVMEYLDIVTLLVSQALQSQGVDNKVRVHTVHLLIN